VTPTSLSTHHSLLIAFHLLFLPIAYRPSPIAHRLSFPSLSGVANHFKMCYKDGEKIRIMEVSQWRKEIGMWLKRWWSAA
ncbi:MAG TPA: hypothetical protein PK226_10355, partial [Smithellaceae bacterium]|nr:hypothetical protein [Smithellaceae bacterium]